MYYLGIQLLRCLSDMPRLYRSVCQIVWLSSFFFFSSRRRHTRFDCDWSSDVCSSDLANIGRADFFLIAGRTGMIAEGYSTNDSSYYWLPSTDSIRQWLFDVTWATNLRSEERRVGKECRSRWSPDH